MKTVLRAGILLACITALMAGGCSRKQENSGDQSAVVQKAQPSEYYTCPMHPSVRSDKPGACPVCHMSLVKVSAEHRDDGSTAASQSVQLSEGEQIMANVATALVESRPLTKEISAVGKIDLAESNTQRITTRFGGRIEKLFVSFVGQQVQSGEPVAEIYSPDAIAAQQEYLVALNASTSRTEESPLLRQTRSKLRLWGFTDQQLHQLETQKALSTTVTIYSPITGTVLTKNVDLQQYVGTGESLFEVSDLRKVWLLLDVYESDCSFLRIGQIVKATLETGSPDIIKGSISFISPTLDPTTRTVRVRAALDNPSGRLKPEMFAQAVILVPLPKGPVVPASAVISNGKRDVVWVEGESGHFEPRQVTLGARCGEFYQILKGLQEGESVASQGAYLIDSESQLRRTTAGDTDK